MKGLAELKCAQRFEYLSWLSHRTSPGTIPNCLLRFKIVFTRWAWELRNHIQITSQHCKKKGKTQSFLVIIAWNSLPQNERNKTLSLQPEHAWAENMEALWGHLKPPEWKHRSTSPNRPGWWPVCSRLTLGRGHSQTVLGWGQESKRT